MSEMAVASVAKITAPIVWDVQSKFRIQDLHEAHYDEVVTLIKHHYFREEPMCKSIQLLQDAKSTESYLDLIRVWMKDTCSLIAVSEKSGRVVGTVICRIDSCTDRSDVYNRVQIYEGEALESIMQLKNALTLEAKVHETLGHDRNLQIYVLCVHPSYKGRGVGEALIEACCLFASTVQSSSNIPVIAGIFTSNEHQLIAEHVGLSLLAEIAYNNWLIDEEVLFDDPGVGNYSAALMYILTPDEETLKRNKKMREKEEKLLMQRRLQRSRGGK